MRRRDLTPGVGDTARELGRVLAQAKRDGSTVPHGVQDLGASGDTVWTDPDTGDRHSVRDLPPAIDGLASGVSTVSRANTVSTNPPPPSTEGYPLDAIWTQIASVDGHRVVAGVWQATDQGWVPLAEDASRLAVGQIDVGLLDAVMVGAALVEAGAVVTPTDAQGRYARIDSGGLWIQQTSPDGATETLARLGPNGDNYLTIGQSRITPDAVSAPTVNAGALVVQGRPLGELMQDHTRVIARAVRTDNTNRRRSLTRLAEIKTTLLPNRLYRLSYSSVSGSITIDQGWADMQVDIRSYRGWSPSGPDDFTVEKFARVHVEYSQSQYWSLPGIDAIIDTAEGDWRLTEPTQVSILACINDVSGDSAAVFDVWGGRDQRNELRIEDLGVAVSGSGYVWQDAGELSSGGSSTTQQRTTYTDEWAQTAAGSYWMRDNTLDTQYGGQVIQGSWSGSGSDAREGYFVFPDVTGVLAGVTVNWARIKCYVTHTYAYAGASARLWSHNQTGLPATRPGMITQIGEVWAAPGSWIDVEVPSHLLDALKSGAMRGFGLGVSTTGSTQYYLRATDGRLQINYTK